MADLERDGASGAHALLGALQMPPHAHARQCVIWRLEYSSGCGMQAPGSLGMDVTCSRMHPPSQSGQVPGLLPVAAMHLPL